MAECDWAILCDYAFLDVGRKMCLIGVFDRVFAQAVPTGLPQAALAIKLLGNPGEQIDFRVELIRPTGAQLATFGGTVIVADTGTIDVQVVMAGLPLPDFGLYNLNILAGNALLKTTGFLVTKPVQRQPGSMPQ